MKWLFPEQDTNSKPATKLHVVMKYSICVPNPEDIEICEFDFGSWAISTKPHIVVDPCLPCPANP